MHDFLYWNKRDVLYFCRQTILFFMLYTFSTGKYTFEKIDESPLCSANSNKEMNCSSRMTMYANECKKKSDSQQKRQMTVGNVNV